MATKTDNGSSNDSVVDIRGGSGDGAPFLATDNKGGRGMNVKQLTWVFYLRTHGAAHDVARLTAASWALLQAGKRRILDGKQEGAGGAAKDKGGDPLLQFIRGFLALCLAVLGFELVGYWNGWSSYGGDEVLVSSGKVHAAYLAWISIRANHIGRPLQAVCNLCVVLCVIQAVDRLVFSLGCFWINFNKIKPTLPSQDASQEGDRLMESSDDIGCWYPKVLIQIPMCNEREVYEQSISAACQLDWPKDRFLVQVLDDSDDKAIQLMIRAEVEKWSETGTNIVYRHRLVRTGYKAGNLKSAMSCDYVKDCEFVAIFDADFQPNPDFLKRTVPHFKDNPDLGLVQARWNFVNKDQNLLTRLQYINMCYHFEVEQQVNGVFFNFFGFNGTAGVWRIQALEGSGGWMERTTVEDMDIAVRAHLNGWKFIFLNDVRVPCEVPELYEAYRKQQHRWHSGPMNLFRLCLPDIFASEISLWKKANVLLLFFLLRKLILPLYSFLLMCVILPLTMFVPEAEIPVWMIFHVPLVMAVLNVYPAPGSFPFVLPYLFFENTMAVTKFHAMISGLLQLRNSYEWVVTKKSGRSGESDHKVDGAADTSAEAAELKRLKEAPLLMTTKSNKIYKKELALALLLMVAAVRGLLSARPVHFYLLLFQGLAFLIVGLDLLGGQITA